MDFKNLSAEEADELLKLLKQKHLNKHTESSNHRKHIKRELKNIDKTLFFLIIDDLHHPVLIVEPETEKIIHVNHAAELFYGYNRQEFDLLTMKDINLFSDKLKDKIIREELSGKKHYIISPHKLKSGEMKFVEIFINPVILDGSRYMFFFVNDVTETLLARYEVEENNEKIQRILNAIPDTVVLYDRNGNISLNKTGNINSFYYNNDFVGKNLKDVGFSVEVQKRILSAIREVLSNNKMVSRYFTVQRNPNMKRYHYASFVPLDDKQVLSISRDMTDAVLWAEKENRYNLILDNLTDAVLVMEIHTGRYVDCNRTFINLFGYSKEEFLNMTRYDFLVEPEKTNDQSDQDNIVISSLPLRCKNGDIKYCDVKSFKAVMNEKPVQIAILNDVTELIRLSEELKSYKDYHNGKDKLIL